MYSCVDGDGVVPSTSARTPGLPLIEARGFEAMHKPMLDSPEVAAQLLEWLKEDRESEKARKERFARENGGVEVGEEGGWVIVGKAGESWVGGSKGKCGATSSG